MDGQTTVLRFGAGNESPRILTVRCSDLQLCFYRHTNKRPVLSYNSRYL